MSSNQKFSRRTLLKGAVVGSGALLLSKTAAASIPTGLHPNTSTRPYALPSIPGVHIQPILTTGDLADNGYRMGGIPDGLGALRRGRNFEVFMNHEIPSASGITRAHGSKGAFVSKWVIKRHSLEVLSGEDLTPSALKVHTWNGASYVDGVTTAWNRLCSADLPAESALSWGRYGTCERIFLDGEETSGGRAWARIVTGPNAGHAYELPRLGKLAFENVVACPHGKKKTIVVGLDDGSINTAPVAANGPCEVYVYIGTKQTTGTEIERAGLTNGKLYGVQIYRQSPETLVTEESNDYGIGNAGTGYVGTGRFRLVELGPAATPGDVSAWTGAQLQQNAIDKNVTRMLRVEDGAWDPREHCAESFYFVTTGAIASFPGHALPALTADYTNTNLFKAATNSRLWRLKFDDIDNPLAGGKIEILLSGTELGGPGWRMFDNICIDRHGRLLLQEDTGNHPWIARIWVYGIDNDSLTEVAHHDPELFDPSYVSPGVPGPDFITQDEESSGIIDAEHIWGRGWFLFDVQNHKAATGPNAAELFEGGQLLRMYVNPRIGVPHHHRRPGHHHHESHESHGHSDSKKHH